MAEVRFDALAAGTLERLYDGPTKTQLADRVEEWLDRLEVGDEATTRDEYNSRKLGLVYVILVYGSGLEAPLGRTELRALPRPGRVALTRPRPATTSPTKRTNDP